MECGLWWKWLDAGAKYGYSVYVDKGYNFTEIQAIDYMDMDAMNIAFGPYILCISFAIGVLLVELLRYL